MTRITEELVDTGQPAGEPRLRLFPATRADSDGVRIASLSIDGFGALANREVGELGSGISVILGPNEAGKSTLFDFLTAMLFGFAARRDHGHFRAPVSGGRHGGRACLVDARGGTWTVERHTTPAKSLVISRPDGSLAPEHELVALLGGATSDLFRAVFAVDLGDLSGLATSAEVREVLFSSTILGQRRSAAQAMKLLQDRRDSLARPRQGDARVNQLHKAVEAARADLADAVRSTQQFASHQVEAAALTANIVALREEEDSLRHRAQALDVLQSCWDVVERRRIAERTLGELGDADPADRRLLAVAPEVRAAKDGCSGHLERMRTRRQLADQREGVERSVATLRASLQGTIGADVAENDADLDLDLDLLGTELDTLKDRLRSASEMDHAARAVLDDATAREATTAVAVGAISDRSGRRLPTSDELETRVRDLRLLRSEVLELEQLTRTVEADAASAAHRPGPSAVRSLNAAFVAGPAAVVLLLLAGVLGVQGQVVLATIVGALAVAFVVLGLVVSVRSRDTSRHAGPDDQLSGLAAAAEGARQDRLDLLGNLRTRAVEQARALGLTTPASLLEIDRQMSESELALDVSRQANASLRAHEETALHVAEAQAKAAAAARDLDGARRALRAFGAANGLVASDDPATIERCADQVRKLRERLSARARIEAELLELDAAIGSFELSIRRLAERLGHGDPTLSAHPNDLEVDLAGLELRIATATEDARRRHDVADEAARASSEIDRVLGSGPSAEALRRELEHGRVLEWADERTATRARIEELRALRDEAVREHDRLARQIDRLTSSDEIPRLEQRCQQLEEELASALQEYVVATGARWLLQRTLKKYEEERQPLVLARAAEHFERVTDGRYRRLVVDSVGEGSKATDAIRAVTSSGSSVDAAELSRGTMEQLYLCLRLGLAESFADRSVSLPIVLDDVLVNFDSARAHAVAVELAEAATRHQIVMLTCHPHLAQLMTDVSTDTQVLELSARHA